MPTARRYTVRSQRILGSLLICIAAEGAVFGAEPANFPPRDLPPAPQIRPSPPSRPLQRVVPATVTATEESSPVVVALSMMAMIDFVADLDANGGDESEGPVTGFGNDAFVDAGLLVDPAARLR